MKSGSGLCGILSATFEPVKGGLMDDSLIVPNANGVKSACQQFDRENEVVENALADLFAKYPANSDPSHVLLKVVALNSLYSTRILAVLKLAAHICEQGAKLDAALAAGLPEAVDTVASVTIGGKEFTFYSFATKYCNWHKPDLYPIYDSRVEKYLWFLKKREVFRSDTFNSCEDLWSYPTFCDVMTAFRDEFGLGSFSFKQIDKFLWSQGQSIWLAEADETAQIEPGGKNETIPAPVAELPEPQERFTDLDDLELLATPGPTQGFSPETGED